MGALSGVRVIEAGVAVAGPYATKYLALLGAEVIKIESRRRLDTLRLGGVSAISDQGQVVVGSETAAFNENNINKLGITLDMTRPEAVDIVKRLVEISDVVLQNWRPGVMERLGLGYSELREVKPNIIMLSSSKAGGSGPEAYYSGYASTFSALGGLGYLTGYPDGPPTLIAHPTDMVSAVTATFAVLAALIYWQRTGRGQHIDLSSREAASCLIGDSLLDYTANRRVQARQGNVDDVMSPHNCYRCLGEDKWISIVVATEEEWGALCNAMGNPGWTREERFSDSYERWQNQEELDRLIQAWTIELTHYEVMDSLQHAGVAAVPSFNAEELASDPHLGERGLLHRLDHPLLGALTVFNPPWKLSATPAEVNRHGPLLGEHNEYVLGELLGLSREEITDLVEKEVIC